MKTKPENQSSPEAAAGMSAASAFTNTDDLVGFASSYFASDFSNPARLNCPPTGTLDDIVRSGKLPDEKLRAHLFGCSECFKEYQAALPVHSSVVSASTVSWWDRLKITLSEHRGPAFAGALSLIVLLFIGGYVLLDYRSSSQPPGARNEVAGTADVSTDTAAKDISKSVIPESPVDPQAQTKQPTPVESPKPIKPEPAIAPRPPSTNQVPRDLVASNTVRADLEDYTSLRGGADSSVDAAKAISISRPRARLLLTLPEGSAGGSYEISIVDNSGKSLVTATAHSADGKSISTTLNLQRIRADKYRLRVSRKDEVPGYYPLIVGEQKPASLELKP